MIHVQGCSSEIVSDQAAMDALWKDGLRPSGPFASEILKERDEAILARDGWKHQCDLASEAQMDAMFKLKDAIARAEKAEAESLTHRNVMGRISSIVSKDHDNISDEATVGMVVQAWNAKEKAEKERDDARRVIKDVEMVNMELRGRLGISCLSCKRNYDDDIGALRARVKELEPHEKLYFALCKLVADKQAGQ